MAEYEEDYVPISDQKPEPETQYSPEQEWAMARAKELELEAEPPQSEEAEVEAPVEEVVEVAEESPSTESYSSVARKVLAAENKLRQEREQFKQEQQEFKVQLAEFQKAQQFAKVDPAGYLASLGIDKETIVAMAKETLLADVEDLAPEAKQQLQLQQKQREMERWKQEMEQKYEQQLLEQQNRVTQAKIDAYVDTIRTVDNKITPDAFPLVAKFTNDVEGGMDRVKQILYDNADALYRQNGEFMDLGTGLAQIENELKSMQAIFKPAEQVESTTKKETVGKKVKGSLDNTITSVQPNADVDLDWENDYENSARITRERALRHVIHQK